MSNNHVITYGEIPQNHLRSWATVLSLPDAEVHDAEELEHIDPKVWGSPLDSLRRSSEDFVRGYPIYRYAGKLRDVLVSMQDSPTVGRVDYITDRPEDKVASHIAYVVKELGEHAIMQHLDASDTSQPNGIYVWHYSKIRPYEDPVIGAYDYDLAQMRHSSYNGDHITPVTVTFGNPVVAEKKVHSTFKPVLGTEPVPVEQDTTYQWAYRPEVSPEHQAEYDVFDAMLAKELEVMSIGYGGSIPEHKSQRLHDVIDRLKKSVHNKLG